MITGSIERLAEVETSNPFPGLRPFEFYESHLFFGREGQNEQLISKLGRTRFLAVVGTSGSGKSSLVRAGLLPALLGGFMPSAGSSWRIAIMRPGNDPIGNLARALNEPDVFGSEKEDNTEIQLSLSEAILRRGSLGLVELVRQAGMPSHENLLVVVDQFEELFRFARVAKSEQYANEAAAFVKLLLEAPRQDAAPIYVVLTMRSDYLGDCARFRDLPEAINESQYLIPRMTRDQLREAVTGPVAVGLGEITSRLVNRLLNDVGDDPDQLPILQHALMRTWNRRREDHEEDQPIDLRHYEAIGGMAKGLSHHADQVFETLPNDRSRVIAEKVFKCLTERGPDNRKIRRPLILGEICAITEFDEKEVIPVIEAFRQPGRSFLMPPASAPLTSESLIDISHESLIRGWEKLSGWVEAEAESASVYLRLAETTALYRRKEAGLWRDPDLQLALEWREQNRPNQAWARRYHPDFDNALGFLAESQSAREKEKDEREKQHQLEAELTKARQRETQTRRIRLVASVMLVLFILSVASSIFAFASRREALKQQKNAENSSIFAFAQRQEALKQQKIAEEQREAAETEKRRAEEQQAIAEQQTEKAEASKLEAEKQRQFAEAANRQANVEKQRANNQAEEYRQLLYTTNIGLAQKAQEESNTVWAQDLLFPKKLKLDDLRTFAWYHLVFRNQNKMPELRGHTGTVWGVAYGKLDEKTRLLATAGNDNSVTLWTDQLNNIWQKWVTLVQGARFPTWHTGAVYAVAFSHNGQLLATAGDNKALVWNLDTLITDSPMEEVSPWENKALPEAQHKDAIYSVVFSPDDKVLATASKDGTVKLWNLEGWELKLPRTLSNFASPVRTVAFSPNSKMLATGGRTK